MTGKVEGSHAVLDEFTDMEFKLVSKLAHSDLALKLDLCFACWNPFSGMSLNLNFVAVELRTVAVWGLPSQFDVAGLCDHC